MDNHYEMDLADMVRIEQENRMAAEAPNYELPYSDWLDSIRHYFRPERG